MKLDKLQIADLAKSFDLEEALVKTVLIIESSGSGFTESGIIKIQFEPHIFKNYTGISINNKVDVQNKEWVAYNEAYKKDSEAAMLSTSWGLGQIMGFNHILAGYEKVEEMVKDFKESEYNQLKGMLSFIKSNKKMYEALKKKDWDTFAEKYNGKGYRSFNYHIKLKNTYNKIKNV